MVRIGDDFGRAVQWVAPEEFQPNRRHCLPRANREKKLRRDPMRRELLPLHTLQDGTKRPKAYLCMYVD